MMGKIMKRNDFGKIVNYTMKGNNKSKLLATEGVRSDSKQHIAESFSCQAGLNTRIRTPVYHISLSFSKQDSGKLTDDLMVKIAGEYMEKMNIKNTQYIIVRHYDREHPHIHLVINIETYSNYKRVRKVNWILKGINENIVTLNDGKTMTLGTVYRLNAITLDKVKSVLEKYKKPTTMVDNTLPYIMVIDELNRGNVSKIFGELITLLETDKRKGKKNEESVILPFSKKMFAVPDNVYIIATMNTADRSLGTLDYAIRRRFAFIACKPYSLAEDEVEGFDEDLFKEVSSLFISNYDEYQQSGWEQSFKLIPAETLSSEYSPEDVWIGQSYFIMTNDEGEDITSDRLLYEIIPLLEEYVRDGVLTEDANETIELLYQKALE